MQNCNLHLFSLQPTSVKGLGVHDNRKPASTNVNSSISPQSTSFKRLPESFIKKSPTSTVTSSASCSLSQPNLPVNPESQCLGKVSSLLT